MKQNQKVWRAWKVLSLGISIVIRMYWYRFRRKSPAENAKLWGRIGKEFRTVLFELNGILIKVGQLMSIREDLLPKTFIAEIKGLVDSVPPSPWEKIEQVLREEWGPEKKSLVQSIEPVAVASASIGEVYKATLEDGSIVAIKVQRPDIQELVRIDFWSLGVLMKFAKYVAPIPKGFIDFNKLYTEVRQVIEAELDFEQERRSAEIFQRRFEHEDRVKVPRIYRELSTERVLVLEWIDAHRVNDLEFIHQHGLSGEEISDRLLRSFFSQWLEAGIFHADPHAGNILIQQDGTIVMLDFGMIGEISESDATLFRQLLEGILLKNYAKAAEAFQYLGFLLPGTNPKQMEPTLREFATMDWERLKQMDMLDAQKMIQDMVRSLPVQVPTRFVFLGRSFATVEGLLLSLNPTKETIDILKPAFFDWLKTSDMNKWELLVKWFQAQPVYRSIQKIVEYIEAPVKAIEQKDVHHFQTMRFTVFESHKKFAMYGVLLFTGVWVVGEVLDENIVSIIGPTGLVICAISYIFTSIRFKKWWRQASLGKID
ncbi:ABC1 kinase family protein [Paenisporosarcina cavernae]|uniref:AarF/ABC1/UbiB kinase family protein n=1 Tax=Paenisporosarcina cavernae TaxID=2320858 RepID=A0A385YPZ5_9BACL|nr:AarF/UbiB family protein [Paenisporosarcina cavernae]AYC28521.1 AarF/ABC1/UbiB kinase family protein [Paenisporosarcina cavernae]